MQPPLSWIPAGPWASIRRYATPVVSEGTSKLLDMTPDDIRGPKWDVTTGIPDLTGKVAIVTGANSRLGIGSHIITTSQATLAMGDTKCSTGWSVSTLKGWDRRSRERKGGVKTRIRNSKPFGATVLV